MDLSKAFDCVNRSILLHKLNKYGVRGIPHNLIKSYLENRKQYLETNNIKSQSCPTNVGVPQGSVLSPLLFLIYINDLSNSTDMEMINFADDTLLYYPIKETKNIESWLNMQLQNVNDWMKTNKLKLNLTKTNYMLFSPKSPKFKKLKQFKFHGNSATLINEKFYCKYLGLIIDKDLNWKEHILNIRNKLAKIVGILYRVRNYLNKKSLTLILNSLFISKLKYGILCYARASQTALQPIKTLFNQALRCINFLKRTDKSNKKLYLDEARLTLDQMFELEVAKFCFKFNKNQLPILFNNFYTKIANIHSHKTRNFQNRLYRHNQSKKTGLLTLAHIGSKLWDKIPTKIKNLCSVLLLH